jgi:hypothetical protein
MVARREADCPLCGAKLAAAAMLDACEELIDAELGVLAARCPHCQGYLEVLPEAGAVLVGYLTGGRFEAVRTLPAEGLAVLQAVDTGTLALSMGGQSWRFGLTPA